MVDIASIIEALLLMRETLSFSDLYCSTLYFNVETEGVCGVLSQPTTL